MNGMWLLFAIFLGLLTLNHLAELRIRRKILALIEQDAPIGQIEQWVIVSYNRYKLPMFAQRRDFYAEIIFTEKAIFVFRMFKLGTIKLRENVLCLANTFDDMPKIDSFWFKAKASMLYKIDSLSINGRRVLIECSLVTPPNPNYGFRKISEHKLLIQDLRDNNAYKNLLLFAPQPTLETL